MRPVELQLEGFTAFREPTTIDFRGADLFALTGPTGSGKTSIVDAMVFALYGSVPRLDRRAVAPIMSLGSTQTRVSFRFTVGEREYRATRVVRPTKGGGATTAEARLESEGLETVSSADDVTEAIEELVGLDYDHFIKCVVLPQGEFAAFLHDQPRNRQRLLKRLLDLEVYEKMRTEAVRRRDAAGNEKANRQGRLAELPVPEDEEVDALVARYEAIGAAIEAHAAAEVDMREKETSRQEAERTVGPLERQLASLDAIAPPAGIDGLTAERSEAEKAVEAAARAVDEADQQLVAATARREALGAVEAVERLIDAWDDLGRQRERRAAGAEKTAAAAAGEKEAEAAAEAAAAVLERARSLLVETENLHRAHVVAETLVSGEPCPVCAQTVSTLPTLTTPADLDELRSQVNVAGEATTAADAAHRAAVEHRQRCDVTLEEIDRRIAEIEKTLDGADDREMLAGRKAEIETAVADVAKATADRGEARAMKAAADLRLEAIVEREHTIAAALHAARDTVVELGAPPLTDRGAAVDWQTLATWAKERRDDVATALEAARAAVRQATAASAAAQAARDAIATDHGFEPPDAARDMADARARIGAQLELIERNAEARARYETELAELTRTESLAGALATHLNANRFEAWILEEALHGLVVAANHLLADLSGGAYSLVSDEREFSVIDHRNADARRSARTLSGGETFLVSLSLALALSEQFMQMGSLAVRLESIILDEGFGTLDAETLDTVASVIHELGSSGRTVGIITHVKELAEQIPIRYQVRKVGAAATVTRVES